MRYGMAIDLRGCAGCHTCSVACKLAHNLPKNIWWNNVLTVGGEAHDTASGTYPNNELTFMPFACQHCENPSCVAVCPTGATYKREEDGIVVQDTTKCIGCRACETACPYTGVRTYLAEEPDFTCDIPVGDYDAPVHTKNTMEKCDFCLNRLQRGEKPACMEFCPGDARFFGDLDDPNSDVCKAMEGREYIRLKEEEGTKPNVFYLI